MRRAGRDFRLISVLSPLRLRVVGVGADLQSWSRGRDSSRSDAAGDPVYVAGSGFQVRTSRTLSGRAADCLRGAWPGEHTPSPALELRGGPAA